MCADRNRALERCFGGRLHDVWIAGVETAGDVG
jgi:hypothetical protein